VEKTAVNKQKKTEMYVKFLAQRIVIRFLRQKRKRVFLEKPPFFLSILLFCYFSLLLPDLYKFLEISNIQDKYYVGIL